jgi:D-sedoheptulose 7-phosphate isomerase
MQKIKDHVNLFLENQSICIEKLSAQTEIISKITNLLIKTRDQGKSIYVMGNGGSGSTASHFVSDLLKTAITKGDKRFSAISLVDNTPVILAWSNDSSYEEIFVEQLHNLLSKGDVVIAFSGSGKSKNIIKAFKFAKKKGAYCIGFTGMNGGSFPKLSDICCIVNSDDMLIIESAHLALCHCIITTIRKLGKPIFRYE